MASKNIADGSSWIYLINFLEELSKTFEISKFRISKEFVETSKKSIESFSSVDELKSKYADLLKLAYIHCEIGPYFRLTEINLKRNGSDFTLYDADGVTRTKIKIASNSKDIEILTKNFEEFLNKQEFLISLRKSRYVDPCYVDSNYIEELWAKFIA